MQANFSHSGSAAVYRLDQHGQRHSERAQQTAYDSGLVFVTGASRSGTTMLARMLGSHSEVMTFPELHFFGSMWDPDDADRNLSVREMTDFAATLLARQTHGLWGGEPSQVERAWARKLAESLPANDRTPAGLFAATLMRLTQDSGRRLGCEQTPRNIFYARRLLELYPNARFVHIVRDPRAVLASQKNRWKLRSLGASHLPLTEMIRNWVNYHPVTMSKLWMRATEEAVHLEGHPRFMVVRFEDLASDPVTSAHRICRFLDLRYQPEMLSIPRWGSSNVSHSSETKGVSTEVVDRWLKELSKREVYTCERSCHLLMQRFGYETTLLGEDKPPSTLLTLLSYPLHAAGVVALNPARAWVQLRALARSKRGANTRH